MLGCGIDIIAIDVAARKNPIARCMHVIRSEMNGRSTGRHEVGLSRLPFDYNSVPSSLAKFLSGQADRIRRQCVTSIIQIGKAGASGQ